MDPGPNPGRRLWEDELLHWWLDRYLTHRFPHEDGDPSKPEEIEHTNIQTDFALRIAIWIPGQAREIRVCGMLPMGV